MPANIPTTLNCPVCGHSTRASNVTSTTRLLGLPDQLVASIRTAKMWFCSTCAGTGIEHPCTFMTFRDFPQVIATYHNGTWHLDPYTPALVINSITNPTPPAQEAAPVPATTPTPAPAEFMPSAAQLGGPGIRIRVDGSEFFFRDHDGHAFRWMHQDQPVEMGHWEQFGTAAEDQVDSFLNFCNRYLATQVRCDCGRYLERDSPQNVYRRGLTNQQVQEIDGNTAGYFHCNDEAHHPDHARKGYLRFTDGTILEYRNETWEPRTAAASPAPAGVDPQEVLRLLVRQLQRNSTDHNASDTDLLADVLVELFLDPPRATVGNYKHLDLAVAILRKSGHTTQAQLVEDYEGPDDEGNPSFAPPSS